MSDFVRVLFDEARSSAWSINPVTARRINPVDPADDSYATAATVLLQRGHSVEAHHAGRLTAEVLTSCDVLVLAHFAEPDRERTSGVGAAMLGGEEVDAVERFVRDGGGLVVLGEHDQDRYGNNLNDLLERFGVKATQVTPSECAISMVHRARAASVALSVNPRTDDISSLSTEIGSGADRAGWRSPHQSRRPRRRRPQRKGDSGRGRRPPDPRTRGGLAAHHPHLSHGDGKHAHLWGFQARHLVRRTRSVVGGVGMDDVRIDLVNVVAEFRARHLLVNCRAGLGQRVAPGFYQTLSR